MWFLEFGGFIEDGGYLPGRQGQGYQINVLCRLYETDLPISILVLISVRGFCDEEGLTLPGNEIVANEERRDCSERGWRRGLTSAWRRIGVTGQFGSIFGSLGPRVNELGIL